MIHYHMLGHSLACRYGSTSCSQRNVLLRLGIDVAAISALGAVLIVAQRTKCQIAMVWDLVVFFSQSKTIDSAYSKLPVSPS